MSAPKPPSIDDDLLAAVTREMVALHERYHHRAPVTAKTVEGDPVLSGSGEDERKVPRGATVGEANLH